MASETLQIDSIPIVDLRFLSQSDLHALSHFSTTTTTTSSSSFDPRRCHDDLVIPQIDRSVFNESAGSRKQTYSRLRLAPRKPHSSSSSAFVLPRRQTDDADPERAENYHIIGLLKELFGPKPSGDEIVPIQVEYGESVSHELLKKRKRGRPTRENDVKACDVIIRDIVLVKEIDEDIVKEDGRNGMNLEALASSEDPYDVELLRRTGNLRTEEEVLGYLGEINGKWGTWRRKKKFVDATEFGDALPKGWKLLVSIRKKQGRVWLYVSRYIRYFLYFYGLLSMILPFVFMFCLGVRGIIICFAMKPYWLMVLARNIRKV